LPRTAILQPQVGPAYALRVGPAYALISSLDLSFREDESRLRERHLTQNFAWLNRFALSLLKQHPGRQSLVMKRRSCGWSDAFLMEVITVSTC